MSAELTTMDAGLGEGERMCLDAIELLGELSGVTLKVLAGEPLDCDEFDMQVESVKRHLTGTSWSWFDKRAVVVHVQRLLDTASENKVVISDRLQGYQAAFQTARSRINGAIRDDVPQRNRDQVILFPSE